MVKAYLRYVKEASFGCVCSTACSSLVVHPDGNLVFAPALEAVVLWDTKRGVKIGHLSTKECTAEVTALAITNSLDKRNVKIAVGHADGSVRIWSVHAQACDMTFEGHKKAVTSLQFSTDGSLLFSGGRDTDVVVWDVVAESGVCRLRGHKNEVTGIAHIARHNMLITSSKDTLVKVWDLDTQHCQQTLVGHRQEVWSLAINEDETRLVTGSSDHELRYWRIKGGGSEDGDEEDPKDDTPVAGESGTEMRPNDKIVLIGTIMRKSRERVVNVKYDSQNLLLACQSADKNVEVFRVRSGDETKKVLARRRKRQKESAGGVEVSPQPVLLQPTDELVFLQVVRAPSRVSSFAFMGKAAPVVGATDKKAGATANFVLGLNDNRLEIYAFTFSSTAQPTGGGDKSDDEPTHSKVSAVELPGHRGGTRALALSSDAGLICSAASGDTKIWNSRSRACIRTMECGYALCCAFAPADRHVLVGTKAGKIEIYELASGDCLEVIDAHEGAVWSIHVRSDGRGFMTGSADHDVKFWDFELTEEGASPGKKRLTAVHSRTLTMSDEVLCVKYSPDCRFVAIALLDCTVRVFFDDSLKFYLSMYGHKLPVMCIDISLDSTLLVSGSADKNVKIWGLDFGDCHKSMFAHSDTVMQVQFVSKTHYFFTVGKDKLVKYWDADKFELITVLDGHHAEVWSLAVAPKGDFLVTGGNDRSMVVWKRTDEQLFLEEERENEMEAAFEEGAEGDDANLNPDAEAAAAGKKSMATLKSGERLMEAIGLVDFEVDRVEDYEKQVKQVEEEREAIRRGRRAGGAKSIWEQMGATEQVNDDDETMGIPDVAPPAINPVLLGKEPTDYLLGVLKGIRASHFEEALLVLHFPMIIKLLGHLVQWLEDRKEIELCCKAIFFLVRYYQNQIVANRTVQDILKSLSVTARRTLNEYRDTLGFNLAAMRHLKRELEQSHNENFLFREALKEAEEKQKASRKKARVGAV